MKKFAIVDFEDDQGLETSIVPSEWIQMETGQCYWPDQGDPQRAVIDCLVPRKTWGLYSFKGIKYETDEYPKAAEKLKSLLQAISDKWCMSSSESDDEERFSAQQTKRSCADKNGRSQGLPLLEFTPQPMIMKPRAASQLWNSQPTPQAQSFGMLPQHVQYTHMSYTPQPLRARPRSSRPSSCMRPRPGTSSTNMQTFDDLLDPHHCEGTVPATSFPV
ncbi:hypothetical protein C0Q70_13328 [Pomacea canaliculata]|uniref:Uncharacterized protein n=1 Tax=Pomacea canaliculata TaxID=400727 RepID=A0A2T7NWX2_POMCA|nr:hypothetical protein C0Q70_13328 [Pomacea canaliculata]